MSRLIIHPPSVHCCRLNKQMSTYLHAFIHAPHANEWTVVRPWEVAERPKTYAFVAYSHPDSPETKFGALAATVHRDRNNEWVHGGLMSLVQTLEIPSKPDKNVRPLGNQKCSRVESSLDCGYPGTGVCPFARRGAYCQSYPVEWLFQQVWQSS